jgi:hypothetical protein
LLFDEPEGQRAAESKRQSYKHPRLKLKPLCSNLSPLMIIASQTPQLMKIFSMLLFLLSVLSLLSQPSDSTTILVDGFSEWKDPNVYIGDSISEH